MRRMHHIWPGQHWPMSPAQEAAAIAELTERAGKPASFDRDDVSAIIGILRCGSTWDRVLELAPGLSLPSLLGAYRTLSGELDAVRAGWRALTRNPAPSVLATHATVTARLLPVPVHRALFAMEDAPSTLPAVMSDLADQVRRATVAAQAIERRLATVTAPAPAGVTLGERLFSTTRPGLYADPFYLADRVAALSPVRISELLGEGVNA